MKLSILSGATSQSVNVFIQDSSSTTGAGLTGLVFNSSGLTAYYSFAGANATATAITLATLAAVNSAYSSGGFKEIDATNMPGWYRLDIPNAVLATSKGRSVGIHLKGATNMAPCPIEIELTGWDNQDSVHGGLTCLPNTAVTTNGSLITSGSGTDQLTLSGGIASSDAKKINAVSTSSVTTVNANVGTTVAITGDAYARLGAPAGASVSADIAAVKSDTGTILTDVNTGAGAIYTRIGAPAGASIAADIAAVETNAVAIKAKTDSLTFTVAGLIDSNVVDWKGATAPAMPTNFASLLIDGSGKVAFNNTVTVKKNTALAAFEFVMTDSTNHVPAPGLTITPTRSIDGGAFGACSNAVTEIGSGAYYINLSAGDLNGNVIMLKFSATGADDLFILIVTQP